MRRYKYTIICLGLLLAPLLSWASGQARLGWTLAALGLLSIPEEVGRPKNGSCRVQDVVEEGSLKSFSPLLVADVRDGKDGKEAALRLQGRRPNPQVQGIPRLRLDTAFLHILLPALCSQDGLNGPTLPT